MAAAEGNNISVAACYNSLAYFFCAQHPIEEYSLLATTAQTSRCSSHQRPLAADLNECFRFCEPLVESCGSDANSIRDYCLTECRNNHGGHICTLLRISGVPSSYPDRLRDINTRFRSESESYRHMSALGMLPE